jgi:hypothetical protein
VYKVLNGEFSGFIRAQNEAGFNIPIDPVTGYGEVEVFIQVYPGGTSSDPDPAPLCVPLSAGWELLPGEGFGATKMAVKTSSPRGTNPLFPARDWSVAFLVSYQHPTSTDIPETVDGTVEAYAFYATYGGIAVP